MVDMVELYNNGQSYAEIAKVVGKSKKWVMNNLKGKISPRPAINSQKKSCELIKWDNKKERDSHVIKLYSKNIGGSTIAKMLSISKKTVYRILKNEGYETNNKDYSKFPQQKAYNLYQVGHSLEELGRKFNVSSEAIRKSFIKSGYKLRDNSDALSAIPCHLQDEVIKLSEEKLSSYKIASKFGLSYQCVQNFLKRHKLSPAQYSQEWKEAVQRGIVSGGSSLESKLGELLKKEGIEYSQQFQIDGFRYDFAINDSILIEIQGSYWHSKKSRRQRDAFKRKLAARNDKKLVVIWDHEINNDNLIISRIKNKINPPNFNFKGCIVRVGLWQEAKSLLDEFHYQQSGRAGHVIVCESEGKVIGAVILAAPTRAEIAKRQGVCSSEIFELTRFVINPLFQARNFATWFMARAIKMVRDNFEIKLLISFADPTFGHDGTIYRASNWKFDGTTPASYWYYHRRNNKIWHKKTIWNRSRKLGITETECANADGLLRVWGQEKLRFIFHL